MKRTRKFRLGAIVLAAAGVGGVSLVGLGTADAAPAASLTAATTVDDSDDAATTATEDAQDGPHEANGITETELTGDDATSERMETDADGAAFEAHVTLADGTRATVKLDAEFTVTATDTDSGHGGR